jgi:peptidoglycan/xylan/chitin deacetylase (PgdA/CDA1 family)
MTAKTAGGGALVLSLDFELRWGVRHNPVDAAYDRNLMGAREVVPRLLDLFDEFGVAATWATVGFLFARSRDDLERFRPAVLPGYKDPRYDPYRDAVGEDEAVDPLHYGASLVHRIGSTARQEIATHTYSHYFCGEAGQTAEQFHADLSSARRIADRFGFSLRSIVLPRNQHNPAYDEVLREGGIIAYRGNPGAPMWRFSDSESSGVPWMRAARLLDGYLPLTDETFGWETLDQGRGLANVRASYFLRGFQPRFAAFEGVRLRRLVRAIRRAASAGRIVHLWWHPHNFGGWPEESLAFLRALLIEFDGLRRSDGMRSLSMGEVAEIALAPRRLDGIQTRGAG